MINRENKLGVLMCYEPFKFFHSPCVSFYLSVSELCCAFLAMLSSFLYFVTDPDSDISLFAKRTVKDVKLPPPFVTQIAQSIQVCIFLMARMGFKLQLHLSFC